MSIAGVAHTDTDMDATVTSAKNNALASLMQDWHGSAKKSQETLLAIADDLVDADPRVAPTQPPSPVHDETAYHRKRAQVLKDLLVMQHNQRSPTIRHSSPTKNEIYLIKSFFDKTIGRLKRKRHAKYDSFQIFNKRRRAGKVRFFSPGSMTMTLPLGQGIFFMKSPTIFSMKDDHDQELWEFFDINEAQFLLTCTAPFNWIQAFALYV